MHIGLRKAFAAGVSTFAAILFCSLLTLALATKAQAQILTAPSLVKNACINKPMSERPSGNDVEQKADEKYVAAALVPSIEGIKPPSLDAEYLFTLINDHRKSLGLPPFEKDQRLCQIAKSRGPEIYSEVFISGKIHQGLYARNLPFWITENMKWGGSETSVLDWWLHSDIHRRAIEGASKYSCGECYGNGCVELFTNWEPKVL